MFALTFRLALLAQWISLVVSLAIQGSSPSNPAAANPSVDPNIINVDSLTAVNQTSLVVNATFNSDSNSDIIIPWNDAFYTVANMDCSRLEHLTVQQLTNFLAKAAADLGLEPAAESLITEYRYPRGIVDLDFFYLYPPGYQARKLTYGEAVDLVTSVLIPWIRRRDGVAHLPLCDFIFDVMAYRSHGARSVVARGSVSISGGDGEKRGEERID